MLKNWVEFFFIYLFLLCWHFPSCGQPPADKAETKITSSQSGTAEVHLFLPFRGKPLGDSFDNVNSYLISVILGFDEEKKQYVNGFVIVGRDLPEPMVEPKDKLNVVVKKDVVRDGVVVEIKGMAYTEKSVKVIGFSEKLNKVSDAIPGKEVVGIFFELDVSPDNIVYVDIVTRQTKVIAKEAKKIVPPKDEENISVALKKNEKLENTSLSKKNLKLEGDIEPYADIRDVFISEGYLYIATGISETLDVLDLHDINAIKRIRSFSIGKTPAELQQKKGQLWYSEFSKVRFSGKYVFILNKGFGAKNDLLVLDTSIKTSPVLVTSYDTKGEPMDIYVQGNYIYLVTQKDFQVLDMSNIKHLKLAGAYKFEAGQNAFIFSVEGVTKYAYVCGGGMGLLVLDVSNPSKIKLASQVKVQNYAVALKVYKNYLFLSDVDPEAKDSSVVNIYDITNPSQPQFVKAIYKEEKEGAISFYVKDDELYIGISPLPPDAPVEGRVTMLKVFDIQDALNVNLIDEYSTETGCPVTSVLRKDTYVYLVSGRCGLIILRKDN